MISELKDTPNTMVGFELTGEVTKEEFDKIVLPAVAELIKRIDKLNYLLIINTSLQTAYIGEWLKEAMLTQNTDNKWNRAAIISTNGIESFVNLFTEAMHGELRRYNLNEIAEAISWVGEQDGLKEKQILQEEGTTID